MIFTIDLLFLLSLCTKYCIGISNVSKMFRKDSILNSCGTVVPFPVGESLATCSLQCLKHGVCTGILLNKNIPTPELCKLIFSGSSSPINMSSLIDYEHFAIRPDRDVSCTQVGFAEPKGWRSACPALYFPLDSNQSVAFGGSLVNANFSIPGKIGNSIYLENDGSVPHAYYSLGSSYTSDQFCFPSPESCGNGASFAFWMKIPRQPTTISAYLTTRRSRGPGFVFYWSPVDDGLISMVKRDVDTKQDHIIINRNDFVAEYGFDVWVHYCITYRYVDYQEYGGILF